MLETHCYLVTGGAGFIGSHLVRQLLDDPATARVVVVDMLSYAGSLENLAGVREDPQLNFIQGDIADQALMGHLLQKHQIDVIFHLAAETHVDRSIYGPLAFVQTNVMGTGLLLEAVRQYWRSLSAAKMERFRFIHISTDEVYGSSSAHCFSEDDPYRPNSPYSASKAAADHLIRAWYVTFGLPVLTSHCSNNFGPFQHPEKLLPKMLSCAIEAQKMPLYGSGSQVRDWLYVSEHARFLRLLVEQGVPGEVYNLGGESEYSNREILHAVCRIAASRLDCAAEDVIALIETVADRPGHDFRYAIDNKKVRQELGWQPEISFNQALEDTVDWYLNHRQWLKRRR